MKKLVILSLIILVSGCRTTRIHNSNYKISAATTELGSIGQVVSVKFFNTDFVTKAFPVLENKIRLDVRILPFTNEINEIYLSKSKNNQAQVKINYVDSLPNKPEFVNISILDLNGFAQEINAPYNKTVITYLKDAKTASLVTDVALTLPAETIAKLRQADTHYLINSQDKKYEIALYSQGKKTEVIDLRSGTILAYNLSRFCWAVNDRQQWYVGDIVTIDKDCTGSTIPYIKEKEQTNLFKM